MKGTIISIIYITIIFIGIMAIFTPFLSNDDELYTNKNGIIVSMGQEDGYSMNKFHTPTQYHTLLIRDLNDTTLFLEWTTGIEQYYNYKKWDTVHFDYIRKDRWFHITRK